jgi:hypothetical protein
MMDENITNVDQFIEGAVVLKEKPYFTDEKLRNFAQMMLDAQVDELDVESDVGIGKPKMRIWIRHPNFTKADKLSDIMTMAYRALNGLLCEVFRAQWHTKELQAEIRTLQAQQSRALELACSKIAKLFTMPRGFECESKGKQGTCNFDCVKCLAEFFLAEACEAQERAEMKNNTTTEDAE